MVCKKCGKESDGIGSFCAECGASIDEPAVNSTKKSFFARIGRKKIIIASLVTGVVIITALALFLTWYFGGFSRRYRLSGKAVDALNELGISVEVTEDFLNEYQRQLDIAKWNKTEVNFTPIIDYYHNRIYSYFDALKEYDKAKYVDELLNSFNGEILCLFYSEYTEKPVEILFPADLDGPAEHNTPYLSDEYYTTQQERLDIIYNKYCYCY